MLPDVKLLQPFTGSEAQQLVSICPKKVFDIEDMGTKVRFYACHYERKSRHYEHISRLNRSPGCCFSAPRLFPVPRMYSPAWMGAARSVVAREGRVLVHD